jgi:hypothetical protein
MLDRSIQVSLSSPRPAPLWAYPAGTAAADQQRHDSPRQHGVVRRWSPASRAQKRRGLAAEDIQALTMHADVRTAMIYLGNDGRNNASPPSQKTSAES